MSLEIVILAAGMGKRMHSTLPKVLHKVAGKAMLQHVIETAAELGPRAIHVVIGHGREQVEELLKTLPDELKSITDCVVQEEQLGTGHAVKCALTKIDPQSDVLVLYGDTPLTPAALLADLVQGLSDCDLVVLSANTENPTGYGRIIRNTSGLLEGIVEEKDASPAQKQIREVNTGMIATTAKTLNEYLPQIGNKNAQHEYYLTDLAGLMADRGLKVGVMIAPDFEILSGVNSKVQLNFVERLFQRRAAYKLMEQGVTLADPERFDLRGTLCCGDDCFIDINCVFEGKVTLGKGVSIGPGCIIKNCTIADNAVISPYTVMEDSTLGIHTTIGPFARLRPGNKLDDEVHVGNFVELKKAHLGFNTKAGHLSYLGDTDIGREVNIGAGTITCNYDGANKFRTEIGDNVFVGSDSQLVAPVTIKNGVTIGAGTTVTRHIRHEENALIVTRAQSRVLDNYPRPKKKNR